MRGYCYLLQLLILLICVQLYGLRQALSISGLDRVFKRIVSSRILQGQDAQPESWPWQVALLFYNEWEGSFSAKCGAALISDRWLLTATHCIDHTYGASRTEPSNWKVVLGAHDLNRPSGREITITPDLFLTNGDFILDMKAGYPNDIALIRLPEPVPMQKYGLITIDLPTAHDDFYSADCYITGWGITEADDPYSGGSVLQEAPARLVPQHTCKSYLDTMESKILNSQICVGGSNYPTACTGDSGSPLSCKVNGKWKLAGIYSWYLTCGGMPSVYTRVTSHLGWIANQIAKHS